MKGGEAFSKQTREEGYSKEREHINKDARVENGGVMMSENHANCTQMGNVNGCLSW